jgi:hypothetical protein
MLYMSCVHVKSVSFATNYLFTLANVQILVNLAILEVILHTGPVALLK